MTKAGIRRPSPVAAICSGGYLDEVTSAVCSAGSVAERRRLQNPLPGLTGAGGCFFTGKRERTVMTDFSGVFVRAVPSASVFREGRPTDPRIGMEFLRAFCFEKQCVDFLCGGS